MSGKKQDDSSFGVAVFALLVACFALGVSFCGLAAKTDPTPTPAVCCKADECRKELALVDARFGDVWDELVEVQEQLAKLKPCGCGPVKECSCEPSKPCACSDKPACECKPQQKTQLPVHRVLKRCK